MEFRIDHPIIFILVGIILAFVVAQSLHFMIRAVKRARELGVSVEQIKSTIVGSAIFTIAPSIAIVVGVISLSQSLGIAWPWFRLSIVGSLTYEISAFGMAIAPYDPPLTGLITDGSNFVTIAFVMTSGILSGPLLVPLITKKVNKGLLNVGMKDKKWGEVLNNAMFMGLVSAFVGMIFCNMTDLFSSDLMVNWGKVDDPDMHTKFECLIAPLVMITSSVCIAIFGILGKKPKMKWLMDYALPLALLIGMAVAIPLTMWLANIQ